MAAFAEPVLSWLQDWIRHRRRTPMDIMSLCRRNIVTISPSDELLAAAQLMRVHHVGYLVVTEPVANETGERPVGVLTDRDIVVRVLARGADPRALRVGDVMTPEPQVVRGTNSLNDALRSMRQIGVRRMPVVGQRSQLIGVLSLDEILEEIAGKLSNVAASIHTEQRAEEALLP
jgi:CBS domain-containing protein